MTRRREVRRPTIDLGARHEQDRLFSAVADLARAGAGEPMEDALERVDHAARALREEGSQDARLQLEQIRDACDRLSESLSGEQFRVMRDLAEIQGRIQQRRRYTGAQAELPVFDRRG